MSDLTRFTDALEVQVVTEAGNSLAVNADGSLNVSVSSLTKTPVLKTGTIVSTTTTADQVVLSYTVTAAKTFYFQYLTMTAMLTTLPGNSNPILLGTVSLENPSGSKVLSVDLMHPDRIEQYTFADGIPIVSGTVIRVVTTPSAATSTRWRANLGGFES